jgi:hypothetical protein
MGKKIKKAKTLLLAMLTPVAGVLWIYLTISIKTASSLNRI